MKKWLKAFAAACALLVAVTFAMLGFIALVETYPNQMAVVCGTAIALLLLVWVTLVFRMLFD